MIFREKNRKKSTFFDFFKKSKKNQIFFSIIFFSKYFFSMMKKYFSMGFFFKFISWSRRIVLKRFQSDSDSLKEASPRILSFKKKCAFFFWDRKFYFSNRSKNSFRSLLEHLCFFWNFIFLINLSIRRRASFKDTRELENLKIQIFGTFWHPERIWRSTSLWIKKSRFFGDRVFRSPRNSRNR